MMDETTRRLREDSYRNLVDDAKDIDLRYITKLQETLAVMKTAQLHGYSRESDIFTTMSQDTWENLNTNLIKDLNHLTEKRAEISRTMYYRSGRYFAEWLMRMYYGPDVAELL